MDYSLPGSSVRGFSGKNTGADCHAILQGIFPTQGWKPAFSCLLYWQAGSLPLVPSEKTTTYAVLVILFDAYVYMLTY